MITFLFVQLRPDCDCFSIHIILKIPSLRLSTFAQTKRRPVTRRQSRRGSRRPGEETARRDLQDLVQPRGQGRPIPRRPEDPHLGPKELTGPIPRPPVATAGYVPGAARQRQGRREDASHGRLRCVHTTIILPSRRQSPLETRDTRPRRPSHRPPSDRRHSCRPPILRFVFSTTTRRRALTAAPSRYSCAGNEMNNNNRFPSSKLKLDEFFLNWLSSPESQKLVRPDPALQTRSDGNDDQK